MALSELMAEHAVTTCWVKKKKKVENEKRTEKVAHVVDVKLAESA